MQATLQVDREGLCLYPPGMLTLDQFLAGCAHETRVIQHLATKIPAGGLDYRPTPGQRSMAELMRYMTRMAVEPMARAVDGDWSRGPAFEEEAEAVELGDFAAEMDVQMDLMRAEAEKLRDRDLTAEPCSMPWGAPCTLGEFLVNAVGRTYTAYRMQFFLYVKAAGAHDLGPAQCWVGVDLPPA